MDIISQSIASWFISFVASLIMWAVMGIWITIVAFKQKPVHGIVCLATAGIWCVVYGFMQGKQLLVPTIILMMAVIVGTASGIYTMYKGIRPAEDREVFYRMQPVTEKVLAQAEITPGVFNSIARRES